MTGLRKASAQTAAITPLQEIINLAWEQTRQAGFYRILKIDAETGDMTTDIYTHPAVTIRFHRQKIDDSAGPVPMVCLSGGSNAAKELRDKPVYTIGVGRMPDGLVVARVSHYPDAIQSEAAKILAEFKIRLPQGLTGAVESSPSENEQIFTGITGTLEQAIYAAHGTVKFHASPVIFNTVKTQASLS